MGEPIANGAKCIVHHSHKKQCLGSRWEKVYPLACQARGSNSATKDLCPYHRYIYYPQAPSTTRSPNSLRLAYFIAVCFIVQQPPPLSRIDAPLSSWDTSVAMIYGNKGTDNLPDASGNRKILSLKKNTANVVWCFFGF